MARKNIVEVVTDIAQPVVDEAGFELVDVEFVKEGSNWFLRIFIDKPGGITIDDCQIVSERLSDKLDKADPIKQSYFLEVSSPGLDRPLKNDRDFERYKGELVELKVYRPINGNKEFEGILDGLYDGKIYITDDKGCRLGFDRDSVAVVRRAVKL
jgi:ribosome maturation factor RimP